MPKKDAYYTMLTEAAAHPEGFKVCAVCGNIAEAALKICPHCTAYRFETDPEHVSNTAIDQAMHERTAIVNLFRKEKES